MSHPLLWPRKHFFYPIGNTPATCLTSGLAPEQKADILLLGCGDARNILFTIHSDHGIGDRPMDFTCVDYDPVVLARDVILLTALIEHKGADAISKLWNIYYHFYLDKSSLTFLLQHVRRLVDASVDLHGWKESHYGRYVTFSTEYALAEIRRFWNLFLETEHLSTPDMNKLKDSFATGMQKTRDRHKNMHVTTSFRSGGPLAQMLAEAGPAHFKFFWEKGVTSGSKHGASATHINPTLAFSLSGKGFNVHYGTDPLLGFHFAPILSVKGTNVRKEDLADSARAQFKDWCSSFQRKVKSSPGTLKIRLYLGDALAFSNALVECTSTGSVDTSIYLYAWGNTRVLFDEEQYGNNKSAPSAFDVIDTSNLPDHVGMLNTFLVTIPLLKDGPLSTLTISSLLAPGEGSRFGGLLKALCCDLHLFSLVFGVMPTPLWSGVSSFSNTHEVLASLMSSESPQFHEPICWRRFPQSTTSVYTIDIPPRALGNLLFQIYYEMFSDENVLEGLAKLRDSKGIKLGSPIFYNRHTFVRVLKQLKRRVSSGWNEAMDLFHNLVVQDRRLLMGSNNYQDMCCLLHVHGVHSVDTFRGDFISEKVRIGGPGRGPFKAWIAVPPVVCVVFEVNRSQLKVLESMDPDEIMTPLLQCEIKGPQFHNIHSSVQAAFGRITSSGLGEHRKLTIMEDPKRWEGNAPLIVSFYMPSWILTIDPANTHVGFCVRSTTATVVTLVPKLGFMLEISSSGIMDTARVHIVASRPGNDRELKSVRRNVDVQDSSWTSIKIHLDNESKSISTLSIKLNITDAAEQAVMAKKAPMKTNQISRNSIQVSFAGFQKNFHFMLPVNGSRLKLRIARTSFYLEIEVPLTAISLTENPFPVLLQDGHPSAWNVHYIDLDGLPNFTKDTGKWLSVHLGMMMSDSERRESNVVSESYSLSCAVNLKQSIGNIFLRKAGARGFTETSSVFQFSDSRNGGVHTMIFVNGLKFDVASHTVVADAYVLPLMDELVKKLWTNISVLQEKGAVTVHVTAEESIAWWHLLPALAERCRTWQHNANCEYVSSGRVPLSTTIGSSPICSCGKGKDLGAFTNVKAWKPFAPLVTRIALSPLFCVSYLGHISKIVEDFQNMDDREICSHCLKTSSTKLLVCGACKTTRYCSASCQKADWKKHKLHCKK